MSGRQVEKLLIPGRKFEHGEDVVVVTEFLARLKAGGLLKRSAPR